VWMADCDVLLLLKSLLCTLFKWTSLTVAGGMEGVGAGREGRSVGSLRVGELEYRKLTLHWLSLSGFYFI
jgi:hypothetical protein